MLQQVSVRCLTPTRLVRTRSTWIHRQAGLRVCVVTAVKAHHTGGAQVPIIHKDDPRLSFGSCMQEITRGVAPGTPRQDVDAALALLEEDAQLLQQLQQRPGSCHWAVVKCGVWRDDAEAPKGQPGTPAKAVFCIIPSGVITPPNSKRAFTIFPYHLDDRGLPNGKMFMASKGPSATAFEKRTSAAHTKNTMSLAGSSLKAAITASLSISLQCSMGNIQSTGVDQLQVMHRQYSWGLKLLMPPVLKKGCAAGGDQLLAVVLECRHSVTLLLRWVPPDTLWHGWCRACVRLQAACLQLQLYRSRRVW